MCSVSTSTSTSVSTSTSASTSASTSVSRYELSSLLYINLLNMRRKSKPLAMIDTATFSVLKSLPMEVLYRELKHDVNGKRQTAKIKLSGVYFKPFVP